MSTSQRFVLRLGVVAAALFAAQPAVAQVVATYSYPSFDAVSIADFQRNGSAALVGSVLRVVPGATSSHGSAFLASPVPLAPGRSFTANFTLRFSSTGLGGADGMTFVVHADPRGNTAIGGYGGGLGYAADGGFAAISPSLAVEFDDYQNGWDPDGNHVGLDLNGSLTSVQTADGPVTFDAGDRFDVAVYYDAPSRRLTVWASPAGATLVQLIDATVDLDPIAGAGPVFVGFTAATGGEAINHDVEAFALTVFEGGLASVSVPSLGKNGLLLLAAAFALLGLWAVRRRT